MSILLHQFLFGVVLRVPVILFISTNMLDIQHKNYLSLVHFAVIITAEVNPV